MTTEYHGKKINEIWLAGDGNPFDTKLSSDETRQLELSATHHGEYDQFWVVVKKDGLETERYNVKQLTSIAWT